MHVMGMGERAFDPTKNAAAMVMPMAVAMLMRPVIVGMSRVGIRLTMLVPVSPVSMRMVRLPMRVGMIGIGMVMRMIVLIVQGAAARPTWGCRRRALRLRGSRCSRHLDASSPNKRVQGALEALPLLVRHAVGRGAAQTGLDVILKDQLRGPVNRGPHGGELDQHLRAGTAFLHHAFDRADMAGGPGELIGNDFRLPMRMGWVTLIDHGSIPL